MPLSRKQTLMSASALVVLANACGAMSVSAPAMDSATMLTGSQEVPPVDTKATATSSIAVGDDMSVTGSVTVSGIEATMAHIHEGAMGVSGPPIVTLVKTSDTQWSVPPDTRLTAAQYQKYKAGELYVNVHSAAHKGGEIRLQLKP
jgi:hypothetical protein